MLPLPRVLLSQFSLLLKMLEINIVASQRNDSDTHYHWFINRASIYFWIILSWDTFYRMKKKFKRKPDKSLFINKSVLLIYPLADLRICISQWVLFSFIVSRLGWPDPDADLGNHVWGMRGVGEAHLDQALGPETASHSLQYFANCKDLHLFRNIHDLLHILATFSGY